MVILQLYTLIVFEMLDDLVYVARAWDVNLYVSNSKPSSFDRLIVYLVTYYVALYKIENSPQLLRTLR